MTTLPRQESHRFRYKVAGKGGLGGLGIDSNIWAMAHLNLHKSIYAGDVDAAKRLYVRLLGYGYTTQRFEQGIKASEPLAELSAKDGSRKAFLDGLSTYDRRMLEKAQAYEARLSTLKIDARRLFPVEIKGFSGATEMMIRKLQEGPRADLLDANMPSRR